MDVVVWGGAIALGVLVAGLVVLRALAKSTDHLITIHEHANTLPLDLVASMHDHAMLLLEVQLSISPQNKDIKLIERLAEILTALRYSVGLREGHGFTIRDKGKYRTALTLAVVKLMNRRWNDAVEAHRGQREALQKFDVPKSVERAAMAEQVLEVHIEEMAAMLP